MLTWAWRGTERGCPFWIHPMGAMLVHRVYSISGLWFQPNPLKKYESVGMIIHDDPIYEMENKIHV